MFTCHLGVIEQPSSASFLLSLHIISPNLRQVLKIKKKKDCEDSRWQVVKCNEAVGDGNRSEMEGRLGAAG